MARVAVGAVTITDIADGLHPISVVLSNQSHTFAADTAGVVPGAERGLFGCEIFVYVGATRCVEKSTKTQEYDGNSDPIPKTYVYEVSSIQNTAGWGFLNTITDGQANITCSSTPDNVVNRSGTGTLTIDVTNSVGTVTQVKMSISLATAIEGMGGSIIRINPSRNTFHFDEAQVLSTDSDINLRVVYEGFTGIITPTYAWDGSDTFSALTVGVGEGNAKHIDVDGTGGDDVNGNNDSITISPANFGDHDVMTIRLAGASGGMDTMSIVRVRNGKTGAASLFVSIKSSVGGMAFKNNTGAVKTLTAQVFDMATGADITDTVDTFQWMKNQSNVGTNSSSITVTPTDITDGGSEEYSCTVTIN